MLNQIKAGKLTFGVSSDAAKAMWSADGLPLKSGVGIDFWRVHMDDGENREMTVKSSKQTGTVRALPDGLDIRYDRIIGNNGRIFDVKMTVHIRVARVAYESFEMWAEVEHNDSARLNELQLPFVDLSVIGTEKREDDILYKMNGLGEKIHNPWEALKSAHTEYMSSDYNEIWDTMLYPCFASMCWFGIESNGNFLYVGKHDSEFRTVTLSTGLAPRHAEPRMILSISNYLLAKQGERLESAHSVVSLNDGDWKTGSDIYGAWARKTWYTVPQKPEWVQNLTGWQRIILKHQYGEIFFSYSDLPRIYKEGEKYGLKMLMIFGWWKGRFDNGYPLYEPDPILGGEQALKDAIEEIHQLGGRVALYTNGVLIDVKSDFYKETGYKICRKDIDDNEYREHYKFSNDGMLLRSFGYKSFVSACQATDEWKDKLIENGKVKLSFNPDSIFYDQIGGHFPNLCFDETHKHKGRGDSEVKWRIENMRAIKALCDGDKAFGTEFTIDAYAPHIDYHHGCLFGNIFGKTAFPDLFMRTFPEPIMTNRFLHDDREDFKKMLNYAFVYGFRFDVSIYRGRKLILSDLPDFAAYVQKLIELKEKYHPFFYHGKFVADTFIDLPEGVVMKEYVSEDGRRLFVFWNDSSETKEVFFDNTTAVINGQDVFCYVREEDEYV